MIMQILDIQYIEANAMHFIFNAFRLWLIKGVYAYSCFAVCSIVWLHIFGS